MKHDRIMTGRRCQYCGGPLCRYYKKRIGCVKKWK